MEEVVSTKEFIKRMKTKMTKSLNAIAKNRGYSDWNCMKDDFDNHTQEIGRRTK